VFEGDIIIEPGVSTAYIKHVDQVSHWMGMLYGSGVAVSLRDLAAWGGPNDRRV
jgi:hypothetical protein